MIKHALWIAKLSLSLQRIFNASQPLWGCGFKQKVLGSVIAPLFLLILFDDVKQLFDRFTNLMYV